MSNQRILSFYDTPFLAWWGWSEEIQDCWQLLLEVLMFFDDCLLLLLKDNASTWNNLRIVCFKRVLRCQMTLTLIANRPSARGLFQRLRTFMPRYASLLGHLGVVRGIRSLMLVVFSFQIHINGVLTEKHGWTYTSCNLFDSFVLLPVLAYKLCPWVYSRLRCSKGHLLILSHSFIKLSCLSHEVMASWWRCLHTFSSLSFN